MYAVEVLVGQKVTKNKAEIDKREIESIIWNKKYYTRPKYFVHNINYLHLLLVFLDSHFSQKGSATSDQRPATSDQQPAMIIVMIEDKYTGWT